jgi:hypothetical protein
MKGLVSRFAVTPWLASAHQAFCAPSLERRSGAMPLRCVKGLHFVELERSWTFSPFILLSLVLLPSYLRTEEL